MDSQGVRMRWAAVTACILAVWGCLIAILSAAETSTLPMVSAFPQGGTPKPTVIFPALLSDYYEHNREHTPPRDPGGVMQHREMAYQAPPDSFALLEMHVTASAADQLLLHKMGEMRAAWMRGQEPDSECVRRLKDAAQESTLTSDVLINSGRSFQWLVNEELASALFSAGLSKASREIQARPTNDPRNSALLHQLDQTRALWQTSSCDTLEMRFRIYRVLYPPLSIESRRAGYLLAEAIASQGRLDEAADLIVRVQQEHAIAGDLGRRDRSDIGEMGYVAGYLLFDAGRYSASIPNLKNVRGEHATAARALCIEAYIHTHQLDQARELIGSSIGLGTPNSLGPEPQANRLAEELDRAEWREQMRLLDNASR